MKYAIYCDNHKYIETKFEREDEFERVIVDNSKMIFGSKTIYFSIKNKIDTKSLGSSIPDGILFDFSDKDNPNFYLVEVELAKHGFYDHIFPQITKFFAFFKNPASRNNLIEKLFKYITSNPLLINEFKIHLGNGEIYKTIKDTIENSQNILLILDEEKRELPEVFETYTDTWDKLVTLEILKEYKSNNKKIFLLYPDFEGIDAEEAYQVKGTEDISPEKYNENYHLEGIDQDIALAYQKIKEGIISKDEIVVTNPTKKYISLRKNKNFAFIKFRNKKLIIIVQLPYSIGEKMIKNHSITQMSEGAQSFWGQPSFRINVENSKNIDEVVSILEEAKKLK